MKKKRSILVTGGAGFIGSHMAEELIKAGNDVIIIDNLSSGLKENVPPKAKFVKGDTSNKSEVRELFNNFSFDAIFHIAGNASIVQSFTNPFTDFKKNFVGTVNIVTEAIRHKVPRMLYASSMTIYGNPEKKLIKESTSPTPLSYYGISKYSAERFVHATATRNDLSHQFHVTSLRMFNVYGPKQSLTNPYQGVMGIFIGNMLRNEPITIFGDGLQSRDLIYIDDVVDAWIKCLDNPASYGKVFNVGSGQDISVKKMVNILLKKFKYPKNYPVLYKAARPGEQRHTRADITSIRDNLKWKPKMNLENGLTRTIAWAKKEYGRDK